MTHVLKVSKRKCDTACLSKVAGPLKPYQVMEKQK